MKIGEIAKTAYIMIVQNLPVFDNCKDCKHKNLLVAAIQNLLQHVSILIRVAPAVLQFRKWTWCKFHKEKLHPTFVRLVHASRLTSEFEDLMRLMLNIRMVHTSKDEWCRLVGPKIPGWYEWYRFREILIWLFSNIWLFSLEIAIYWRNSPNLEYKMLAKYCQNSIRSKEFQDYRRIAYFFIKYMLVWN